MEISAPDVEKLLDRWPIAHLASIGPDGRPHQVPIVFARVGSELWSPVDGKPKHGGELVRVRNIRLHSEVSLLLDEYSEDWKRLWWIRIDGSASVVQVENPAAEPTFAAATSALRDKYPQYAAGETPLLCDPPTLLVIRPIRMLSWCGEEGPGSGASQSGTRVAPR